MNIGEVLVGRYKILHRLGQGQSGAVYLAKDTRDDGLVALKEVRTALGDDPSALLLTTAQSLQLSRELKMLEGLSHPHLALIRDHFESAGARCLVMDYVDGATLTELVSEEGPRTEEQALEFARVACDVLAGLHNHTPPVVYRDFKPANVLMDTEGCYMFVDYGLSKGTRRTASSGFAPPEQYEGIADPSGDVYALGATLYYLLTGIVPPPAIDITLGNARLKPLKQLCPGLSKHVMNAIGYMLALNRADRLKNIEAVNAMLGFVQREVRRPAPRPRDGHGQQPLTETPSEVLEGTDRRVGEVLNQRYRIEGILAQGRAGALYRAVHQDLDEPVVLKELVPLATDPALQEDCIRQFRQEARVLNRLRHPNLPRIFDFFELEDRHYLVMELVAGTTLADAPRPDEATVLRWTGELCDVLEYLHGQDPPVLFRELMPANVMLASDGTLRLVDFGLGSIFQPRSESTDFVAPEQLEGECTALSDIYSLGATLYRLLLPPGGKSLRDDCPELSDRLKVAIEWMMSEDPDMRPRAIEETRQALGLVRGEAPTEPSTAIRRLLREQFQDFFPAPWLPRGPLLEALTSNVRGARTVTLMLLSGASGVGKSRLLLELQTSLKDTLHVMPTVQGSRITRQQPFGALIEPLNNLLRQGGETLISAMVTRFQDDHLCELGQLLPELSPFRSDASASSLSPQERTRVVLDAMRMLLEEAARLSGRLLWVMDDAQLLDPSTLRLIDLVLAIDRPDISLAMVLARETGEGGELLEDAIKRWRGQAQVGELWVPPFSRDELTQYLQATLPPIEGLEAHAETLHTLTAGNPLLIEEMLRWMVMRGLVEDRGGKLGLRPMQADSLPSGVGESVRRRLDLLPIDAQELLAVASVIGQHFRVHTLERLSGERPKVVAESLARAHEAVFIRPHDGSWIFVSEATREAFYSRLAPSHRRQLHMTLGQMEEEESTGGGKVAYHFEQAGDVARSLEHVSRFSRDLMTSSGVEIVVRDSHGAKQWASLQDLSEEQMEKLRQAVAFLVRALKSLGTYGPGSLVAQTSLDMAMTVFKGVQQETGPVVISCTETYFSLNNRELDPRQAPPELAASCRRLRISGFEIRPGVDNEQMTTFLALLSGSFEPIAREGGWTRALASRGITSLQVIESMLVEVSERDLFDPSKLRLAQEVVLKEEGAELAPSFSFEKMQPAAAPSRLAPPVEGEAPVTAHEVGVQLESIKELLEELKAQSHGPAPLASDAVPGREMPQDLLTAWGALTRDSQEEDIVRLAALHHMVDKPLATYIETRPELLLSELESPLREHRVAAAMALVSQGKRSRRALLNYLASSDSRQGRAVALFLLTHLVLDIRGLLIARLLESTTENEVAHLLRAMQEGQMQWEQALEVLLRSASSSVRRGAAAVLLDAAMPMSTKMDILRKPLRLDHPLIVLDTLMAVGELGMAELIPDVTRVLERNWSKSPDHVRAQVQACHTLGRIGAPDSVLPILRGLLTRGLQATLLGGYDSEVRSAATWAVGMLGGPEAREMLGTLVKDTDPAVSGTARLAIDTNARVNGEVQNVPNQIFESMP